MDRTYLRGDMYFADLGKGIGSEQEGYRPIVIIQNNVGNKHSPTVIVASISSKVGVKAKTTHPLLHRCRERLGAAFYRDFRAATHHRQTQIGKLYRTA